MGRPTLKERDDVLRTDVAAMDDKFDLATFQHADGRPSEFNMPMRVANDANPHVEVPIAVGRGERG